jgi:hypothetical protein
VFRPSTSTHVAFQTTARAFLSEAEAHRELLVRHGLVESVLVELRQSLDQFDAAMVSRAEARAAHRVRFRGTPPKPGLKATERFNWCGQENPGGVAAWRSVSSVVATPRGYAQQPCHPEGPRAKRGGPKDLARIDRIFYGQDPSHSLGMTETFSCGDAPSRTRCPGPPRSRRLWRCCRASPRLRHRVRSRWRSSFPGCGESFRCWNLFLNSCEEAR